MYFIWLTAKVEFQYICITILKYCVEVQYNLHTLYGRGEGWGAKYLGPGLVRGPKILVKCPVMGATVKMVGGP